MFSFRKSHLAWLLGVSALQGIEDSMGDLGGVRSVSE